MTNVDSGGRAAAEPNTILRATVGSKLHGLNLEATDDTDEMGVCVEPPEYVVGLRQFEQWVYRTQPEGHPSGPKDLDLTIYSLRSGCAWRWPAIPQCCSCFSPRLRSAGCVLQRELSF